MRIFDDAEVARLFDHARDAGARDVESFGDLLLILAKLVVEAGYSDQQVGAFFADVFGIVVQKVIHGRLPPATPIPRR
jgi:hypothetical protein